MLFRLGGEFLPKSHSLYWSSSNEYEGFGFLDLMRLLR